MPAAIWKSRRFLGTITVATCCALSAAYAVTASAQMLKYDNESEVMMAGTVSPTSLQTVLERLIDKCSAYGDDVRISGVTALRGWQMRHGAYLEENRQIRAWVERGLRQNAKARETFHDMVYVQTPVIVDKQYDTFASVIDMMKTVPAKTNICNSYIQSINDGKLDLKNNDPTLAAYLDKRIRARNSSAK